MWHDTRLLIPTLFAQRWIFPNAQNIFEKKEIINDEYIEGALLYVKKCINYHSTIKNIIDTLSDNLRNDLFNSALKVFFNHLYKLYKFAEEDGDPWW